MKTLWLAALTLLLVSCSLVPMKRSEQEGIKSSQAVATEHETTIRRALEVLPISQPASQQVEIRDIQRTASNSQEQVKAWYKQSVPLWLTLCGSALGIVLIVGAFKYAKRSSPTVDAILSTADNELAGLVRGLRSRAGNTQDPKEQSFLHSLISEHESARGRLAKGLKPGV